MKILLKRIDVMLCALFHYVLVILTLVLTLLMASAVFMRYALDTAFPAVEEISILVGLWLYFISMVVVTRERGHLTGGILELLDLSVKSRLMIKRFNDLIGLCVICCFGFYATKYLLFIIKINRVSTNLGWPTALWVSAAIFGFTAMAIYKLRDLFISRDEYTVYDNKSHHPDKAALKENS